ncbi:hypothetical protein D1007_15702 [Hordeum vulgare]|nr:hypothetical protein D1007_15702 [Hordeum vulgare]
MAGGSSSKKSSVQKASSQGAWLGSYVDEGHIEALRHHRLLPPASQVLVRLPSSETAPAPAAGEVVVFVEHFYRGFGLPASSFFAEWLQFFGLQPHHLAPNAILQLGAFVVLYDAEVQAYNELRDQHLGADSRIAELEARLGEVAAEHDALRNTGGRLQEQLDLLQAEKKELEAAGRVELERLQATLQEKEASYSADMDRLALLHLKEVDLQDAALREKDEALVQKQTQLAKALESAATLEEEITRLTHASKVREREILEVSHETDGAFHRLFPETQIAADTAVEVCREECRVARQEVDTTSGWSVEEIGVGLRACLHALGESVAQL